MLFKNLRDEIEATRARDPAARSRLEVVFCYPGFQVLLFHRMAHWLWTHRCYLPRPLCLASRSRADRDRHPSRRDDRQAAVHRPRHRRRRRRDRRDRRRLHDLPGRDARRHAPDGDQAGHKRHPTIGNNVIVSSNAQVLGPFKVGDGATIGAAAVVLREVPPGAIMVGNPARQITRRLPGEAKPAFTPYGVSGEDIPDPIARALSGPARRGREPARARQRARKRKGLGTADRSAARRRRSRKREAGMSGTPTPTLPRQRGREMSGAATCNPLPRGRGRVRVGVDARHVVAKSRPAP